MATKKTATRTRKTPTKKSFESLREEIEEQEGQDPTAKKFALAARAAAIEAVKDHSLDAAVDNIGKTVLSINKAFGNLQEQVVEKWQELKSLDEALVAKEEDLQNLYDKETILSETAALVHVYEREKNRLNEEQKQAEIAWEQAKRDLQKARAREEAEYQYKTDQQRREAADKFDQEDRERVRAMKERDETLVKGWNEREAKLLAQEVDIQQLRTAAASFEAEKKKYADTQVAIATNSLKKDLTQEFQLKEKDLRNTNIILEQRVISFEAALADAKSEIERLRAESKEMANRIVDISKSGFESVSGQTALSALKDVAGQNGSTQKKSS